MPALPRTTSSTPPNAVSGVFREFIRFTRLHEWHPGKLPLLLGFALTLSLAASTPHRVVMWLVGAYLLTSLYLATAYMLNNIADAEQDRMVNKKVGFEAWSRGMRTIPVILTATLGLGLGIALLPAPAIAAMFGCYALAWIYSLPPRLKEHVWFGPFVAAFAQVPAPALTLALAWGFLPPAALVYLVVSFLYGLRMIMVHQILDHDNDRLTATRTTAMTLGLPATRTLLRVTFGLECLCTVIFVVMVIDLGLPAALLLVLLWPVLLAILHWRRGERLRLDTYEYIPLADVHESLMPLLLAVGVAVRGDGSMIGALPLVAVLFLDRHLERLVRPLNR